MNTTLRTRAGRHFVAVEPIANAAATIYRVEVTTRPFGGTVVDGLTRTYATKADAHGIARVITVALRRDGATVADARAAVVDHIDAAITMLFATGDALHADRVAELQALRAGFATTPAEHAARTLDQVAPTGQHRQVAPTMAGAHLTDVKEPGMRVLRRAAANGGLVERGNGVSNVQLKSLARKGLGVLAYWPSTVGRKDIRSLTLNAQGWALVAADAGVTR